ncbi:MAG: 2-succinylbenzoate-CoA ligase [Cyanobacteria bacterium QS_8_64_29]|nr:MAG: 2-succinylbenzoate-CoA ligase [Cyanobacteria bacterium QS_8_64_29]
MAERSSTLVTASPGACLQRQRHRQWLSGCDGATFEALVERYGAALAQLPARPARVLLLEPRPYRFLAALLAAVAADCHVFLGNPCWGQRERAQVGRWVQPDLTLGALPLAPRTGGEPRPAIAARAARVAIPTGGSSGALRFALHSWETLMAAAAGFARYWGGVPAHTLDVLPLYHVSGLMPFLRALVTGGQFAAMPFKALTPQRRAAIAPEGQFLSLVPLQLQRLLEAGAGTWLARFRAVLLGGAPASAELLAAARAQRIPLAPSYGMTETAAQVAALAPAAFGAGCNSSGGALPHARITVRDGSGAVLPPGRTGTIAIRASSLYLGYYGESGSPPDPFLSDDRGYLDAAGRLHWVGRRSQTILTGGESVAPEEVEAALLETGLVSEACVVGLPDPVWGQAVAAAYIPRSPQVTTERLRAAIARGLSACKRPKTWLALERLPRTDRGKRDRTRIAQLLERGRS